MAVNVAVRPARKTAPLVRYRASERKYLDIVVSRLGFEPRTRGLKVSRGAVHGVVLGHSASVSRPALLHPLHQVGPDVTAVAGSVAGRSAASASIASGRDLRCLSTVRPLPCSPGRPSRPTDRPWRNSRSVRGPCGPGSPTVRSLPSFSARLTRVNRRCLATMGAAAVSTLSCDYAPIAVATSRHVRSVSPSRRRR